MTMVGEVGAAESDEAIEGWQNALGTLGKVAIPQLEMATVGVVPLAVHANVMLRDSKRVSQRQTWQRYGRC